MASLSPLPGGSLYTVSKHGVLGLFRSFWSTAFFNGIRVNLLCPYYMDTPLLPTETRFMLAGGAMGKPEDVVEAGTRLMVHTRNIGRALVVVPKVKTRLDDD
jgi:NAD(P)-dependent dehydrogenase (short-subunit alcohol dehydrogenase family)